MGNIQSGLGNVMSSIAKPIATKKRKTIYESLKGMEKRSKTALSSVRDEKRKMKGVKSDGK